jgi:acyl-phosphate glycerol 3-phosphate acyltransferase
MATVFIVIMTALAAYIIGAVPFGYLIARWRGVDIFAHGSGNIGATNVGRVLGKTFGVLVFALDFAKGAVPAAIGCLVGAACDIDPPVALGVVAGLAAFLGHLYPVYLRFKGGKGVATGAGVVAVLLPLPTLGALLTWLLVVGISRFISLASMAAAAALCGLHLVRTPEPFAAGQLILTSFCLIASTLVFVKHRGNLGRLLRGTENRLPDGPAMDLLTKTLHVLAVGLWFGMAVFFSFPVALALFDSFESVAQSNQRPSWFPLPPEYKQADLQKEQGTRAAGYAISPMFDQYFLWQGICGFVAALTALSWKRAEAGKRVHGIRIAVVLLAVTTVVLGWPIERTVSQLRQDQNGLADRLLDKIRGAPAIADTAARQDVERARADYDAKHHEFVVWHLWSLLLNMVTVLLVTITMALAAQLPPHRAGPPAAVA